MNVKRPYANSFWELEVHFWSSNTYMLDLSFENFRGKQINFIQIENWKYAIKFWSLQWWAPYHNFFSIPVLFFIITGSNLGPDEITELIVRHIDWYRQTGKVSSSVFQSCFPSDSILAFNLKLNLLFGPSWTVRSTMSFCLISFGSVMDNKWMTGIFVKFLSLARFLEHKLYYYYYYSVGKLICQNAHSAIAICKS